MMNNNDGRILISPPANVSMNMAIDQALFDAFPVKNKPVLRFYTFNCRAISYGYFQNVSPLNYEDRQKSRRITGGGIVLHGRDMVIAFIFKPQEFGLIGKTQKEDIYRKLQETFRDGLIEIGANPQKFQGVSSTDIGYTSSYECFKKIESNDVVYDGKKLAGFALRRTKTGVLIQSSLRVWRGEPDDAISLEEILDTGTNSGVIINLEKVIKLLRVSFTSNWGIQFVDSTLTEFELVSAKDLIKKYSSDEWNFKSHKNVEVLQ